MRMQIRQIHAVVCFAIIGGLCLLGGGAAVWSHFLLRPVSSDAELGALSTALLATGLVYSLLAALCLSTAWMLFKRSPRAPVLAAVTFFLLVVEWLWSLIRDIQTGVSIDGVVEFVVGGLLLAVIALYLKSLRSKRNAEPVDAPNERPT